METKIIELTEDNQEKYLDQVAELEIKVLKNMEENGKVGQLFITGRDDILEYIKSSNDMVMCSLNDKDRVNSAVYITQGQNPFTYNDITKYFKCSEQYKEYVKNKLGENYRLLMIKIYNQKIKAFQYAKNKVLEEHHEFENITQYIEHEVNSKNGFDEKNELRENINKYMAEYMKKNGSLNYYDFFYWTTSKDIFEEFGKEGTIKNPQIQEYETFMENEKLDIHSANLEDESEYYNSNTSNSIEIDTYITDPSSRDAGLARILVFEGIKRKIIEFFKNEKNKELYLCSTLHKDNLSSKYVSEFFGLKDNLFVKRRTNRDREVHICKIAREKYKEYLNDIQDKLIVLYGYNPNEKKISPRRKIEVLEEQLQYEKNQYYNLNKVRNNKHDYTGNLKNIMTKLNKIGQIKQMIKQIKDTQKGDGR